MDSKPDKGGNGDCPFEEDGQSSFPPMEQEARLDAVIAAYVRAVEAGQAPDQGALLARHPDLAADLAAYFADRDKIERWARPLRAIFPATYPSRNLRCPHCHSPVSGDDLGSTRTIVCGSCGSSFQAEETQQQWPSIPDYQILELLGAGGMGVVYKARQISANRVVALKVIRSDRLEAYSAKQRRDAIERFQTEAQAAAKIEHDHIVPIYDVGESDGRPFYSMLYVQGASLGGVMKAGPLQPKQAALYMEQVARAVHEAHRHAILHRDLKPQNCLLEAGSERVYVVDFGLAKLMQEGGEQVTLTGDIMGTPPYMSPERACHSGKVTIASDVYALGATLYALLTSRPPRQGAHAAEVLRKVLEEEPIRPRKLQPGIPLDLETICLKCLDKDPARRYTDAAQLADRLRLFLEDKPIPDRPVSSRERLWRWCRRNPVVAGAGSAAMLAGVIALTTFVVAFFMVSASRDEAVKLAKDNGDLAKK